MACNLYSNGSDIHCEIAKVNKLVRHWFQGLSISRNKCIELFLFCVFSIHSIVLGFFTISCVLHHPLAMAFSKLHQYINLNMNLHLTSSLLLVSNSTMFPPSFTSSNGSISILVGVWSPSPNYVDNVFI